MSLVRILATVGVSVGAAISAGVYFQPEQPEVALRPAPAPAAASLAPSSSLIDSIRTEAEAPPTIAMLTPIEPSAPRIPTAPKSPETEMAQATPPVAAPPSAGADSVIDAVSVAGTDGATGPTGCELTMRLTAQPAAMLSLGLDAPCDAGEPVAISHGPLLMAGTLDAEGRLAVSVPALAADAMVTMAMLDGRTTQARAPVPDFAMYQRLVVTWTGPAALDLHAYAGGAAWGEPGHVRAGLPVSAATGFVTVLGDAEFGGQQARIYTYPVGISAVSGHVGVEAEIAVTPETCGQDFRAQVHAILGPSRTLHRSIEVAMPACGSPAGFVQVPTLLPETPRDMAALD